MTNITDGLTERRWPRTGRRAKSRMTGLAVAGTLAMVLVTTGFVVTSFVTTAWAHHGWSGYDNETLTTVSGTVEAVSYGNPHVALQITSDGPVTTLTLAPPGRAQRAGLTEESIEVGDQVTAEGHLNLSDPTEMKTETVTVGEQRYELY